MFIKRLRTVMAHNAAAWDRVEAKSIKMINNQKDKVSPARMLVSSMHLVVC